MKRFLSRAAAAAALLLATALPGSAAGLADALRIYFIDVEGGKATLVVTPSGQSILLDAGFAGAGKFDSRPGDPAVARDAQRVLAAARDAGLSRIDLMVVSHYHADHFGGVMELAQLIPIVEYMDHAAPSAAAEERVPGTLALYDSYTALRSRARHRPAAPGNHFMVGDVAIDVVASGGKVLTSALPGGGAPNAACGAGPIAAQEITENPNTTAVKLTFGNFAYLDLGDLSGAPLHALSCPANLVGRADVYNIAHHGGADGADSSSFVAVQPRVAVFSNGSFKGAEGVTLNLVREMGIAGWQLHRSDRKDVVNMPDAQIANLDTTTTAWLLLSANRDGSFSMKNGRTGETTNYPVR